MVAWFGWSVGSSCVRGLRLPKFTLFFARAGLGAGGGDLLATCASLRIANTHTHNTRTMPPTASLNAVGQFFEEQVREAWRLFRAEQCEEANPLALRWLREPRISDLHAASLHLLLAHAPDNYVCVSPRLAHPRGRS